MFGGRRFLLKSIHYDATHRADLFTLPCSPKVPLGDPWCTGPPPVGIHKTRLNVCRVTTCNTLVPHTLPQQKAKTPWLLPRLRHMLRRKMSVCMGSVPLKSALLAEEAASASRRGVACARQALAEYARGLDISPLRPWMLQRMLAGTEYSSYTLAHRGRILAHSDNEACLSCLDYEHVDSQQVTLNPLYTLNLKNRQWLHACKAPYFCLTTEQGCTPLHACGLPPGTCIESVCAPPWPHGLGCIRAGRATRCARMPCRADLGLDARVLRGDKSERAAVLRLHEGRRGRAAVCVRVQPAREHHPAQLLQPARGRARLLRPAGAGAALPLCL